MKTEHEAAPEMSKHERDFHAFNIRNPHVYATLRGMAFEWLETRQGQVVHLKKLYEDMRCNRAIKTTGPTFKLNNNHCPYYSRWLEYKEPKLRGMFQHRKMKYKPTFYWFNDELPPGEHVN